MKTFILLTFGFLAFAFYELSGGADFEPASKRMAQAEPQAIEPEATETVVVAAANPQPDNTASITKIDSNPSVTRVSLNLTNVNDAIAEATEPTVTDSTETPQIILPSLIANTNASDAAETERDIRTVSGSRVNVRGGPSTDYGIVSKLTRGEAVQILEDNGDGWVRMKPVDGGETGWMADFLLTSG
ncbi:SH3 domain-containing protein [Sulfitobacter sp. F26169L]|uniref:SH3 domain-containing protein n=1 Tax=Sulfitobacter sp. F26169L TaxID=2996015 RepID=UPI002260B723|nr:SH3 domain-containing protein [Sulfitobacter sp. F26169L]MCX7566798.1 SH3 domain-containing protein [Sulfitobacter sp. F26169L]